MISPHDPRLTAYASGDLPPAEAARFAAELADDPAARAQVEELRALQAELGTVFATEPTGLAALPDDAVAAHADDSSSGKAVAFEPPESGARGWRFPEWLGPLLMAACVVLVVGTMFTSYVNKVRNTASPSAPGSDLRQIGQASVIYATDHEDQLPNAADAWDYARHLALEAGLNDATIWCYANDRANVGMVTGPSTVITRTAAGPIYTPGFRDFTLLWAVPLGKIDTTMPPTTPIAWSRGLRTDGTWGPDSYYEGEGGYIVYLGGNVQYYRDLKTGGGELVRFDGKGKTSNILEALPPGTRIGEGIPPTVRPSTSRPSNRAE